VNIWTRQTLRRVLTGAALGIAAVGVWYYGPEIWRLAQEREALQAAVQELGWLGPLALVAVNILQIIVAPIPGYAMQIVAGFLYGPLWGGVWGSVGLLGGAWLAMALARRYGRPLVTRLTGVERLDRWERVTHSTSPLVWFVLLLGPTGDLPYFLAGLSQVRFTTVLLLTVATRVPTTFVVAAAGAGIVFLTWQQVAAILITLGLLVVLFFRYQNTITNWVDRALLRRVPEAKDAAGQVSGRAAEVSTDLKIEGSGSRFKS
jgi:uncharacterized membrane protein YdjX (TVP38/TMEM64 family)